MCAPTAVAPSANREHYPSLRPHNLSTNLSSAFVILFRDALRPIETAVLFASLAAERPLPERRHIAMRAIGVAGVVLIVFRAGRRHVGGRVRLVSAFRIAGGILLFLQALTLTFASPGLSSITPNERREAEAAAGHSGLPSPFR